MEEVMNSRFQEKYGEVHKLACPVCHHKVLWTYGSYQITPLTMKCSNCKRAIAFDPETQHLVPLINQG